MYGNNGKPVRISCSSSGEATSKTLPNRSPFAIGVGPRLGLGPTEEPLVRVYRNKDVVTLLDRP
jgi:hypothetical protein